MTDNEIELSPINRHLQTQASKLEEELSSLLTHTGEHGDLNSICDKLLDDIASGDTSRGNLYLQSLPQTTNHKKLFGVLVQLTAHDLMSLINAIHQNNIVEAVEHLSMARYHLGRLDGAFDSGLYLRKFTNNPTIRRHNPYDRIGQIKKRLLELLENNVAQGQKTKNQRETFDLLNEDLAKFYNEQVITTPKLEE